jgi:hypothetical protein
MSKNEYDNFRKCLKIGKIFEKKAQLKICEYYKNKYHVVNENDNYEYDFMLSNGKYYEVKYCSLNNGYNTIFLETVAFNKPSGINTTKANYYIFVINCQDGLLYIKIKVKNLIKIITKNLYCKYFKDEKKEGYVIQIDIIKQYGKVI